MGQSKYQLALQIVGMVDQSLGRSVQMTKRQMKDLARTAAMASGSAEGITEQFNKAAPGIDKMWGGLTKAAGTAVNAMKAAGAAAGATSLAAIKVGSDFEDAMSAWSATANASEADFAKAKNAAMDMGRKTSKTASESANALEYMALAGWNVNDSISALPSVLRLSEATGLDLARTSDLVTDSMSATGTEIKDLAKYLDVVAKANNKSNQTAEMLMEAYTGVGGTMKGLNVPIEDTATALGMLANRGIKGSEGGTALSAIMVNLTTGAGKAGDKMEKLGISAFDSKGKFIGLKATLDRVNEATKNLTEEQRNAAFAAIGGKQHVDALNDLMQGINTTVASGKTEWEELSDSLKNAKGSLEDMANTKMDNLKGDLAIMNSALQDDAIRFYDTFNGPLRTLVQTGTGYIYDFGDALENGITKALPTLRRELQQSTASIEKFAKPVIETGKWLIDNKDVTIGTITGIAAALATLKGASELSKAASGVKTLIKSLTGGPVTMVITVAGLLAGAVAGIATKEKIAAKEAAKANLEGHFGNIALSLEEVDRVAQQVLGKDVFGKLDKAMSAIDDAQDVAKGLEATQKALNKLTWKAGTGVEFSETDKQEFADNLDQMIQNGIKLVESSNYAVDLSVNALFGEGDETGQAILKSFDNAYTSYQDEIKAKGEEIGKIFKAQMIDGILTPAEQGTIDRLTAEYADMLNKVAEATTSAKLERVKLEYSGSELDANSYQNVMAQMDEEIAKAKSQYADAYDTTVGAAKLTLMNGGTQEDYDNTVAAANEQYKQRLEELNQQKFSYGMDTIEESYREEVNEFAEKVPGILDEALSKIEQGEYGLEAFSGTDLMQKFDVDQSTQDAVKKLLEGIQPQIEEMRAKAKELEDAGKAIPESLSKGLEDATMLEAMSGDFDAMYEVLAKEAGGTDSGKYQELISSLEARGAELPQTLSDSLAKNATKIKPGVERIRNYTKQELQKSLDVVMPVNVTLEQHYSNILSSIAGTKAKDSLGSKKIKKNALGSIVRSPELTWVGEAGDSEGIIPINRTSRAAELYNQVGNELKAAGNTGINNEENSTTVTYSPVINISGNADKTTVQEALTSGYQQFRKFMNQYVKDNRRLCY